ncbi:MAG: hypothetical protein C5B60_09110 [Chloroflexi bacterium]|nr:MAG: hypothetical protein C5B60_09110 [Chloroflexota bacterium]
MRLEATLLRSVERHLKKLASQDPRLVWRKRHGSVFTTAGDPDITGLWAGRHFEMELKKTGESPTLLQHTRLAQWQRAGAHTFVIHSLSEFQAAIDTLRQVV